VSVFDPPRDATTIAPALRFIADEFERQRVRAKDAESALTKAADRVVNLENANRVLRGEIARVEQANAQLASEYDRLRPQLEELLNK
jgi:predicted RNase H-like nuclease (RuvC/YqgF family)